MNSSFSSYNNEIRFTELAKTLELIGLARMHIGASEAEDFQLPFDEAYNDKEKIKKYGYREKGEMYYKGLDEIDRAKADFRKACIACPLRGECFSEAGQKDVKKYRESIFFTILSDVKTRKRFASRVNRFVKRRAFATYTYTCGRMLDPKVIR